MTLWLESQDEDTGRSRRGVLVSTVQVTVLWIYFPTDIAQIYVNMRLFEKASEYDLCLL